MTLTISVSEKQVEKLEPSYIAGVDVKWCGHFEKQFGSFSTCQNTELTYDPTMPFLAIFTRD